MIAYNKHHCDFLCIADFNENYIYQWNEMMNIFIITIKFSAMQNK